MRQYTSISQIDNQFRNLYIHNVGVNRVQSDPVNK